MQLINFNSHQNTEQVSTNAHNSSQDHLHIHTLENLIQTLEEIANYLTAS